MKVSREQMAENRRRILEAAGHLFRDRGFDAVSVAEVMKAAGMTHGGFYGHFASKDALIAESVSQVLTQARRKGDDLHAWIDTYLSPAHRDRAGKGCPTAALAAPMRHQSAPARAAMAKGLERQIEQIADVLPTTLVEGRRRAAIGSWAAMVGALILARAVDDPELSGEILEETRSWLDAGFAQASEASKP